MSNDLKFVDGMDSTKMQIYHVIFETGEMVSEYNPHDPSEPIQLPVVESVFITTDTVKRLRAAIAYAYPKSHNLKINLVS